MATGEARDSRGLGVFVRRNSAHSPTKASLAKHSPHLLKRDQQSVDFYQSPTKRHKAIAATDISYTTQRPSNPRVQSTVPRDRRAGAATNSDHPQGIYQAGTPARRQYLTESDKLNNLRGSSGRRRGGAHRRVASDAINGKLSFLDPPRGTPSRIRTSTGFEKGTRLSRTPPPVDIDPEDGSDPPLPPTPERAPELSPGTIRRDREAIFSSGNRRSRRKAAVTIDGSPDATPTKSKNRTGRQPSTVTYYYPSVTSRVKNKYLCAHLQHRNTLQQEIRNLEDELIIERRKAKIGAYSKLVVANEVASFV
ncbi:hypothetical protein ABW19_dt0201377 [Dactylella cylindrospora]|nr:hypothetical protein ABW19_dt0201377 [Dactylella cylindrospora]